MALTANQQSAFELMRTTLKAWGLGDLIHDLRGFIIKGDTNPETLALELSQTTAYQKRFSANAERVRNGLSELKPAEYVALEEQYHNVLNAYGFPQGFYDTHDDFKKFIANDLSPDELRARAQVAHDQYIAAPDSMKRLWSQYFGGKGDALAMILNPATATAVIQDRGQQVAIGGAAAQSGFDVRQNRAQQFQQAGVTLDAARKAYQQIATSMPTDQAIGQRFGTTFTQGDEENDLVLGQADAANKRRTLYGEEQSLFETHSGLDSNAIGVSQNY